MPWLVASTWRCTPTAPNNVDDSERIAGLLDEAGYTPVADGARPDVVVSGSVRENVDSTFGGQPRPPRAGQQPQAATWAVASSGVRSGLASCGRQAWPFRREDEYVICRSAKVMSGAPDPARVKHRRHVQRTRGAPAAVRSGGHPRGPGPVRQAGTHGLRSSPAAQLGLVLVTERQRGRGKVAMESGRCVPGPGLGLGSAHGGGRGIRPIMEVNTRQDGTKTLRTIRRETQP